MFTVSNSRIMDVLRSWAAEVPYFAGYYHRTVFHESKEIETMGVRINGVVIECIYNEDFVNSLKPEEMAGVLVHEVLHLAHRHMARKGHRNHTLWNYATDLCINVLILNYGRSNLVKGWTLKLPWQQKKFKKEGRSCITPETIVEICKRPDTDIPKLYDDANVTAEAVYEYLLKYMPREYYEQQEVEVGVGKGPAKSGKQVGFDEHLENQGASEDTVRRIVESIEASVKNRGLLGGDLAEILKRIDAPVKTGWIKMLKSLVGQDKWKGMEPSYKRYNYYSGHSSTAILKANSHIFADELVVAIDTSGSIGSSELEEFFGVIDYMARTQKVKVIQCDATVQKDSIFQYKRRGDWRKIKLSGRGGTDFKPVFDYMFENGMVKRRTLVYLTDGFADYGFDHHGIDTVWVFTHNHNEQKPPFGKCVFGALGGKKNKEIGD